MKIRNISFGANFSLKVGDKNKTTQAQIKNEINLTQLARDIGVSAPKYEVLYAPVLLTYQTKGEVANYQTNPIQKKHFPKLFNNIYLLDISNISHNDLEMTHCFYCEDGDVEFDCFRFGNYFIKGEINLPPFEMPNNLTNYENNSLAFYAEQIPDNQSKTSFLKDYLKASSVYHQKRASYIQERLGKSANSGVILTKEMLKTEQIRSQMCQNPSDDMASLLLKKLEFGGKQRKAFTLWDEGNGACGHEFSKEKRIESIVEYLDSIKLGIEFVKMAQDLSAKSTDELEKQYYDLEIETGKYFVDTYLNWVSGMADYNFVDLNVCPKPNETREILKNAYNKILIADYNSKTNAINEYTKLYLKETSI